MMYSVETFDEIKKITQDSKSYSFLVCMIDLIENDSSGQPMSGYRSEWSGHSFDIQC